MSVEVSAWVWKHSKTTGNDRLLLLAIADCADDDGDNAWPSVETLADKATCSERTVQRRIQALEDASCLTVTRGAGRNGTHRYRVHMDEKARKPEKTTKKRPVDGGNAVDNPGRGDKLSPLPVPLDGGVKLSPGVTQLCRSGGDTWVSPERPERPKTPQPPRQAGGPEFLPEQTAGGRRGGASAHATVRPTRAGSGGPDSARGSGSGQPDPDHAKACGCGRTRCRACGTSPRAALRAAAAADAVAAAQLEMRRDAVGWCGAYRCDRTTRRVFDGDTGRSSKCPDCHPDLVVGPLPPAAPARTPRPARAGAPAR